MKDKFLFLAHLLDIQRFPSNQQSYNEDNQRRISKAKTIVLLRTPKKKNPQLSPPARSIHITSHFVPTNRDQHLVALLSKLLVHSIHY